MNFRNTVLLVACLCSGTLAVQADPLTDSPQQPATSIAPNARNIVLHLKVYRVSSAKFKEISKVPAIRFPFAMQIDKTTLGVAIKALQGKVLAEPTLVTADGRSANFLAGGEMPLHTSSGKLQSKIDYLDFGTKVEISPRILDKAKIGIQFRFEQTEQSPSKVSGDKLKTNDTVLTSGFLSKGAAVVEPGQSLLALLPDVQSKENPHPETLVMIVLTPEIGESTESALDSSPPITKPPESLPEIEFQTRPTTRLDINQRVDLLLKDSESGTILSEGNIRKVSKFRSDVIAVTGLGPRKLEVRAKQVGESELLITDSYNNEYRVFVRVLPKAGSEAVKDILKELFPKAQVNVFVLNESLLLRGTVTEPSHIQQITEIAEQYAPKILNHLKVASSFPKEATKLTAIPKTPSRDSEVKRLREDIKSLHRDVKRVLNALERKADPEPFRRSTAPSKVPSSRFVPNKDSSGILPKSVSPSLPPAQLVPTPHRPTPTQPQSSIPNSDFAQPVPIYPNPYVLTPRPPKRTYPNPDSRRAQPVPNYSDPSLTVPLPNHSGPNPTVPLPNHSGPNPVRPVPNNTAIPSKPVRNQPIPESFQAPQYPPMPDDALESTPPATFKPSLVPTEPLSGNLDVSSFAVVRTARISSPNSRDGHQTDETLGSGVVIESEPGRAIVLTAAHLLKDYKPNQFVLQVGARQESEVPPCCFRGFYPATIILQDDKADVALLRAKVPGVLKPISLAKHSLPQKQDVIRCVGFSNTSTDPHQPKVLSLPQMVTRKVNQINRYQGPENFEFDGLIPLGFGGAAVLDHENQLMGLVTAMDRKDKRTVCSPAAELRKLLPRPDSPSAREDVSLAIPLLSNGVAIRQEPAQKYH